MANLEEAIQVAREAFNATPRDHLPRFILLNSLGSFLRNRYMRTQAPADLEEAIRVVRESIDATNPQRATWLNNLGNYLRDRYSGTGTLTKFENAIRIGRESVDTIPLDHPTRATCLNNLGNHLRARYLGTLLQTWKKLEKYFIAALHHLASPISVRIAAGRELLSSRAIPEDEKSHAFAKTTIDLIPLLSPRSLQTIALHANKGPAAAIELLETSRGVIGKAILEQSDLSILEQEHPDLARSFIDRLNKLDVRSPELFLSTTERSIEDTKAEDEWHRKAGPDLAVLLSTIRSQPNFDRFLLSESEAQMLKAAWLGPIVVLNVSEYRCDALIIKDSGIELLELPHLSQKGVNNRVEELKSLATPGWLWDAIVSPVPDELAFTKAPADGQWPHVWWIPTGILTQFPLHAAGHHLNRIGETAVDRVVSSYASSVKAIIRSRGRPPQAPEAGESRNAVVVAIQTTSNQTALKHVNDEIDAVVVGSNPPPPCTKEDRCPVDL